MVAFVSVILAESLTYDHVCVMDGRALMDIDETLGITVKTLVL